MAVLSLLDVPMSTESVCSRMTEAALPAPWTAGSSALEERAIRRESKVICENSPFSDLDGLGSWKSESHKPLRSTQTFFMSGWQVCRDAGQIAPMKLSLRSSMSLEVRHWISSTDAIMVVFASLSSVHRIGSASVQEHSRGLALKVSCCIPRRC